MYLEAKLSVQDASSYIKPCMQYRVSSWNTILTVSLEHACMQEVSHHIAVVDNSSDVAAAAIAKPKAA